MDRPIIAGIISLFSFAAQAGPWFVYTNEQGRLQFSQSHADTVFAVGAVQTSAVMPVIEVDPFPQPDTVVPTLDANGVQVGTSRLLVDAQTMSVIAVVDTASPQKPWAEQRAAFNAKREARRQAVDELGLTPQQITAVRAYLQADVSSLFANLNAQQRNFLRVQHALVRYLIKQEMPDIFGVQP